MVGIWDITSSAMLVSTKNEINEIFLFQDSKNLSKSSWMDAQSNVICAFFLSHLKSDVELLLVTSRTICSIV